MSLEPRELRQALFLEVGKEASGIASTQRTTRVVQHAPDGSLIFVGALGDQGPGDCEKQGQGCNGPKDTRAELHASPTTDDRRGNR